MWLSSYIIICILYMLYLLVAILLMSYVLMYSKFGVTTNVKEISALKYMKHCEIAHFKCVIYFLCSDPRLRRLCVPTWVERWYPGGRLRADGEAGFPWGDSGKIRVPTLTWGLGPLPWVSPAQTLERKWAVSKEKGTQMIFSVKSLRWMKMELYQNTGFTVL